MGDAAVLAPDSFLMRRSPRHERWGGIPAREMPDTGPAHPLVRRGDNDTVAATSATLDGVQ
jgi:hypothetical protein